MTKIHLKRIIRHPLSRWFLLWLVPFLILESFFFTEILKETNYLEIFPQELLFPTLMHGCTAVIIATIIFLLPKPRTTSTKLVSSVLLGLLLVNYDDRLVIVLDLFRAALPILPPIGEDIPLISLIFLSILGLTSVWIGTIIERAQRKYESLSGTNLVIGIGIITSIMFTGQAVGIAQILPTLAAESKTQPNLLPKSDPKTVPTDKPDIYYLVFDRYTNNKVLAEQFSFDNTPFTNFLKTSGFTVNEDAYSNYPHTAMSIASTVNASYTSTYVKPYANNSIQARTLYHNLIYQSSVVRALKEVGYEYHHIGSPYGATYEAPQADNSRVSEYLLKISGHKKYLRGIEKTQFIKSPYYQFVISSWQAWLPLTLKEVVGVDYIRQQLKELRDLALDDKQGGRLIFAHVLVPHDPFWFNADGSLSPHIAKDNVGKPIKNKYTDQIQFINTGIKSLIGHILEQSQGKAVVLLNADEGPYPSDLIGTFTDPALGSKSTVAGGERSDYRAWPNDWLEMKYGILQALYAPKVEQGDLSRLSSVNAFRVILNNYLGYDLPYLPNCHYGLSRGTGYQYNYGDITSTFQGEPSPLCSELQSLPSKN